jgi:hypothetical protein
VLSVNAPRAVGLVGRPRGRGASTRSRAADLRSCLRKGHRGPTETRAARSTSFTPCPRPLDATLDAGNRSLEIEQISFRPHQSAGGKILKVLDPRRETAPSTAEAPRQ